MRTSLMAMFFIGLTESSKRFRNKLWQWIYNKIAAKDTSGKFLFMNYGYDDATAEPLSLVHQDEPSRYFIQLYDHVVKEVDLHEKNILEVGCGRGGGGSFLVRYKNPSLYTGVDLSETAITWCQRQFPYANASWKQGKADALPLADNSIDVVVNVESSHCYPSMPNFLSEVHRTLRDNGHMAFCDMRTLAGWDELDKDIKASGLRVVKRNEITPYVLRGLDRISLIRDLDIASVFPKMMQKAMRDFAGTKDTAVYNMLKSGKMKYYSYLLQK